MTKNSRRFAELLVQAVRKAHAMTGLSITLIQDKLGNAMGRSGYEYIYSLREGKILPGDEMMEILAKELVELQGLDAPEELNALLKTTGYPNPSRLCKILFPNQTAPQSSQLYYRPKMVAKRQISVDGLVTSTTEIELQAITNYTLPSVRHKRTLINGERESVDFRFIPGTRDDGGTMQYRIKRDGPEIFEWVVEFEPALINQQVASYSYSHQCRNVHPMTYEECRQWYLVKRSPDDFAYWQLCMSVKTDYLHMCVEFPPNYEIVEPPGGWFTVKTGITEHPIEKARIKNNNYVSASFNKDTKQWTLNLMLYNAKRGFSYELRWIPPLAIAI